MKESNEVIGAKTQDRHCKFEDGTIKFFEEIIPGEVFQICEPDGTVLISLCENKFTWFKSDTAYDDKNQGFYGKWFK